MKTIQPDLGFDDSKAFKKVARGFAPLCIPVTYTKTALAAINVYKNSKGDKW